MTENTVYGAENRTVSDRERIKKKHEERKRRQRRRHRIRVLSCVICCAFLAGWAVYLISGYIRMTELRNDVEEKTTTLAKLDSEYISLNAKKENSIDLSQVEDYAENVLGLVKLDRSQEEYLELQKTDQVEVNEASGGIAKLTSNFVKSFSAFLSFLR